MGMAYRGDTTDPLEIIIQHRRALRNALFVSLLWWFAPALCRIALSPAIPLPTPSQTIAEPSPKMSAHALEQLVRNAPVSSGAPRDVRCRPGTNGWDYVCTYQTDAPHPLSRLKIGVRVSPTGILQASAPHQLQRPLPVP